MAWSRRPLPTSTPTLPRSTRVGLVFVGLTLMGCPSRPLGPEDAGALDGAVEDAGPADGSVGDDGGLKADAGPIPEDGGTCTNPTTLSPSNLVVSGSGNRCRLTWSAPENFGCVTGYTIERRLAGRDWIVVENDYHSSNRPFPYLDYLDTDLHIGGAYEYRMAARAGSLLSSSITASITLTGSVYYVASNGSDSNDGLSPSTAWKTVNKANGSRRAGDLILFRRGDAFPFTSAYIIDKGSGTAVNPIRWDAYGSGPRPRLVASDRLGISLRNSSHWVFANLHLGGATQQTVHISTVDTDMRNIKILSCTIDGSSHTQPFAANIHLHEAGASVNDTSTKFLDDVEVAFSTIINAGNGSGNNDGIRAEAVRSGGHFHNNTFSNNGGECIDVAGGRGHVVEYNLMQCGTSGRANGNGSKAHGQQHHLERMIYRYNVVAHCDGFGLSLQDSKDGQVLHNTVFMGNNGYAAFFLMAKNHPEDVGGNVVKNNIFVGSQGGEGAIRITISGVNDSGTTVTQMGTNWPTKVDWDHNLVLEGSGAIIKYYHALGSNSTLVTDMDWRTGWKLGHPNDLHASPRFNDSASLDFMVAPSSPTVGAGAAISYPGCDFSGRPRAADATIGAFEGMR